MTRDERVLRAALETLRQAAEQYLDTENWEQGREGEHRRGLGKATHHAAGVLTRPDTNGGIMSSQVTAKVIVTGKNETGEGEDRQATVSFAPDYQDGRNKEWARWTPGLSLTIGLKGEVADRFETGQAFLLTFTPEPAEAAG